MAFGSTISPGLLSKVPKSLRPLYEQAYGETFLRYDPQQRGLLALLNQEQGGYQQKVAQANAASDLIQNAALTAQRNLPGQYQQGPLPQLFAQHGVNAADAAKYQTLGYERERDQNLGKIGDQLQGLGGEAGAYFSTRADQLLTADRKLRHDTNQQTRSIKAALERANLSAETQRRGQDISSTTSRRGQDISHADRQAAIDARNAAKGGVKPATPQQQGSLKDNVGAALGDVQRMKDSSHSRPYIAKTLIAGRPARTFTVDADGKKLPAPVKSPAVKSRSQLVTSVALDLAFDGHVSARNVRELHRRGYSLKDLGFPTRAPRLPPALPNQPLG